MGGHDNTYPPPAQQPYAQPYPAPGAGPQGGQYPNPHPYPPPQHHPQQPTHAGPVVVAQPVVVVPQYGRPLGQGGDTCLGVLLAVCLGYYAYLALISRDISLRFIGGIHLGNAIIHIVVGFILIAVGAACEECDDGRAVIFVIGALFLIGGLVFLVLTFQINKKIEMIRQSTGGNIQPGAQMVHMHSNPQHAGYPPQPYAQHPQYYAGQPAQGYGQQQPYPQTQPAPQYGANGTPTY
eukprot:TRINITY_DN38313_c0_g1_i1.p1 TRINITY_DN38313_c0_g1~~TRINITY_DN38313_c0_g1_i1.p1  ORF type:complete len:237 (+),score=22.37 TRINITY_DN38313_c0_g1_i1:116-826(+)